ncbi:hypothetical protein [Clostridiisalibacter paucivorans]|uniref:hypothetical protein n=1 Tax=Clostridiisalibacter paucivorans TaxID=408753 RepID=UPI00047C9C6A|nr:hypothetical protein [Clostridiisalibacter paucivorans]
MRREDDCYREPIVEEPMECNPYPDWPTMPDMDMMPPMMPPNMGMMPYMAVNPMMMMCCMLDCMRKCLCGNMPMPYSGCNDPMMGMYPMYPYGMYPGMEEDMENMM